MLNIGIDQQRIFVLDTSPYVATDSIGFVVCHFEFSDDWIGYMKTAQFSQRQEGNRVTYNQLISEDNDCFLPSEIIEGDFIINVFGEKETGERATSGHLRLVAIHPGFIGDGQTPIPPTPDLYAQLLQQIDDTCSDLNARANLQNEIRDAVQTVTLDVDGRIASVVHYVDDILVRTDTIVYDGVIVTETRELATGESLTLITNTDTLAVTTIWSDGA